MERKFPLLCPFLLKPFTRISKNPIPWQFHQSFQASYWYSVKLEEDSYKCVNGLKRLTPQISRFNEIWVWELQIFEKLNIFPKNQKQPKCFWRQPSEQMKKIHKELEAMKSGMTRKVGSGPVSKTIKPSLCLSQQNRRLYKRKRAGIAFIGPNSIHIALSVTN